MAEKKTKTAAERVSVTLFKDGKDYKDDVFVSVNGHAMKIQRGVAVEIPKEHAEVLQASMEQDTSTAMLVDSQNGKYEYRGTV